MTDEELAKSANEKLDELSRVFGFYPMRPMDISEGVIHAHCCFCNEDIEFSSAEEFGKYTSAKDSKGNIRFFSNCPICTRARARASEDAEIGKPVNLKTDEILRKILKEKFDATLVRLKSNLFADPYETVRFQKGNEKYDTKLFVLMSYEEPELFCFPNGGIELTEDNYNLLMAKCINTGMSTDIDNLLVEGEDPLYQIGEDESLENDSGASTNEDAAFQEVDAGETSTAEANEGTGSESETSSEEKETTSEEATTESGTESESGIDETETDTESSETTEEPIVETEKDENEFGTESAEPETETNEAGESEIEQNTDNGIDDDGTGNSEPEPEYTETESKSESSEIVEDEGPVVLAENETAEKSADENEISEEDVDEVNVETESEPEIDSENEVISDEPEVETEAIDDDFSVSESENEISEEPEPADENEITDEMLENETDESETVESETVEDNFSVENEVPAEEDKKEESAEEEDFFDIGGESFDPFGKPSDSIDAQELSEEVEKSYEVSESDELSDSEDEIKETVSEEEKSPEIEVEKEESVVEENIVSDSDEIPEEEEETFDIGVGGGFGTGNSIFSKSKEKRYSKNKLDTSGNDDQLRDEVNKIKAEENKRWYDNCIEFNDDDESFNEFEDTEDLMEEFINSPFGKCITAVKQRTECDGCVLINEKTYEIPFVDFYDGVRVICIDNDEEGQLSIPVGIIQKEVPFSFKLKDNEPYRLFYLYKDAISTNKGMKATIQNLIKIVKRDTFDPRRIVTLGGKYSLFYTDDIKTIKEFEASNSSYPYGKACSKMIGLIALKNKSGRSQKVSQKDIMNWISKNYSLDLKSVNLYMVASARYIARPIHEQQKIEYTITDYTELGSTMLKDGMDRIIAAIIKEHQANRTVQDPNNIGKDFSTYTYTFEFECDQAALPSPTLEIWYDRTGFIPTLTSKFDDGQGRCYIRKVDQRQDPKDGWRQDYRLFKRGSLQKRFSKEIATGGINLFSESAREKFVERMGFIECYYPRVKRFLLNPIEVAKLSYDPVTLGMSKIDLTAFFSGSGVYEGGYDNLLMQKFLLNQLNNGDENSSNVMTFFMLQSMMNK